MTTGEPLSRGARLALGGLIALACGLLAYKVPHRGIDPDELEHLHAAFCVWQGDVPYRDFFEHHAPGLYYLVWPLFKLHGPQLMVLWGARAVMFACSLATLWLTGRLAARWGGVDCGLIATALLAWTTVFQSKGIELRPDVPAMLVLALAAVPFTFTTGGGSWRRFLVVGILCGVAMLFTQKCIVPVAGIALGACLSRLLTRVPHEESAGTILARVLVPIAAGIAALWGIASLLYASAGAAGDFWYSTWYQLWIWPIRSDRWETLRPTLAGDLTVWAAGLVEIGAVARRWTERESWEHQRGAAAVVAAAGVAAIPFVKATYPQFYLLWMPFLAALAGRRIVEWCRHPGVGAKPAALVLAALLLCAGEFFVCQRAILQQTRGALPHLAPWGALASILCLAFGLPVALAGVASVRKNRPRFVLCFAALGLSYGILRDGNDALWSNREQVAAIEAVQRRIPPAGRVLDGFSGLAALRPHAWYFWWINEYSLALVPGVERETGLLNRLQENPPAGVLLDRNVERLPADVVEWIRDHYEPTDPQPLWVRTRDP